MCLNLCSLGRLFIGYSLSRYGQVILRVLWRCGTQACGGQGYPHRDWALQLFWFPVQAWLDLSDWCWSLPSLLHWAPLKTSAEVTPGRCASLASVPGQRHLPVLPIPDPWEVGRVLAFHSWVYLQCTTFPHSPVKLLLPSCIIKVGPTKETVPELNTHGAVKSGVSRKPTATSLLKIWC